MVDTEFAAALIIVLRLCVQHIYIAYKLPSLQYFIIQIQGTKVFPPHTHTFFLLGFLIFTHSLHQ